MIESAVMERWDARERDVRPFPRLEICIICGIVMVDVISPADKPMCPSCYLNLQHQCAMEAEEWMETSQFFGEPSLWPSLSEECRELCN